MDWWEPESRFEEALLAALETEPHWEAARHATAAALGAGPHEVNDVDWNVEFDTRSEWLMQWSVDTAPGLSWVWGLKTLTIRDTAFLIDENDDDLVPENRHRVLARWTPADDRALLERAVLDAWLTSWELATLPPIAGNGLSCSSPREGALAFRCLDTLLGQSDAAWGWFADRLEEATTALVRMENEGVVMDELGAGAPMPDHDLAWLEAKTVAGLTAEDRDDDRVRRSLVAYSLRA